MSERYIALEMCGGRQTKKHGWNLWAIIDTEDPAFRVGTITMNREATARQHCEWMNRRDAELRARRVTHE